MTAGEKKFTIETFLKSAHVTLNEQETSDRGVILALNDNEYQKIMEVFDELVEVGKKWGLVITLPEQYEVLNFYGGSNSIKVCRMKM